jgi:hypothetical protein
MHPKVRRAGLHRELEQSGRADLASAGRTEPHNLQCVASRTETCICSGGRLESELTDAEYARRLDELDRLLNDPDVPMEPTKVWCLLAEIAQRDRGSTRDAEPGGGPQSEPH